MTAHDLAADWGWMADNVGFRVKGGRVVWEAAEYVRAKRYGETFVLRIGRADDKAGGTLKPYVRYIDPQTPVVLVPR